MTVAGGGHSRAREFPTRRPQAVTRPTVVAARATDAAQWHGHLHRPLGREIRMGVASGAPFHHYERVGVVSDECRLGPAPSVLSILVPGTVRGFPITQRGQDVGHRGRRAGICGAMMPRTTTSRRDAVGDRPIVGGLRFSMPGRWLR
jgi:hypothetical protein